MPDLTNPMTAFIAGLLIGSALGFVLRQFVHDLSRHNSMWNGPVQVAVVCDLGTPDEHAHSVVIPHDEYVTINTPHAHWEFLTPGDDA